MIRDGLDSVTSIDSPSFSRGRAGERGEEFGGSPCATDLVGETILVVKFPVLLGKEIRGFQNRTVEEVLLRHLSSPPALVQEDQNSSFASTST